VLGGGKLIPGGSRFRPAVDESRGLVYGSGYRRPDLAIGVTPMNEPPLFDIFISYAHEDIEFASELQTALGRQGWTVFMDREIPNASRWRDVLKEQLDRVKCILVLWSKASVRSSWVKDETSRGLERKVLVHATIDESRPPDSFENYQYRHLSGWRQDPQRTEYLHLLRDIAETVGIDRAVGTLPDPGPHRVITEDHLALVHSSWSRSSGDPRYPFQIHIMLMGCDTALKRVENVIYYFDPAYGKNRPEGVDPLLKAYVHVRNDWRDNFTVYELANGYSVVCAKVKVRGQAQLVELSRFVNLMEQGPRLRQYFPPPAP
jgi:TIR domain